MKRSAFSRQPTNRIDEEAEHFDESSSSEDYEGQLIPAPAAKLRMGASSNLYDGELKAPGGTGQGSDGEEADDALDDGLLDDDFFMAAGADKEDVIRERIAESQEQMKHLLDMFDEDQLRRYETFRRVGFPRQAIKKLMVKILDQQVNQNSVIVVAGIAKVFVGELVEEARKVMDDLGETGSIQPSHLLEAQRRLKAVGLAPSSSMYKRPKNRLF